MKYVVVDIGCIECGEPSTVLGIFDDKKDAEVVAEKYSEIQDKYWRGDHDFIIFEVEKENKVVNDEYYVQEMCREEKKDRGRCQLNKNLLPIISCVGVVATAVATYIKHDDIEKAAKRLENEKSYKREAVVLFLKEAAMPIIFGTVTIASIAIQNKVSAKRLAAATTAASAASSRFMNYRDKVRKEFGKEADKRIMTEIAKEDWGCQPALPVSKNDTDELFFEPIGGRWFYAKPSRVSEAMYHVNRNLQLRGDAYVNEFYDFIGIKTDKKLSYIGWDAGWFIEELGICPWIDFRVKDGLEDGRSYYIIDYDWSPIDVHEFQER